MKALTHVTFTLMEREVMAAQPKTMSLEEFVASAPAVFAQMEPET